MCQKCFDEQEWREVVRELVPLYKEHAELGKKILSIHVGYLKKTGMTCAPEYVQHLMEKGIVSSISLYEYFKNAVETEFNFDKAKAETRKALDAYMVTLETSADVVQKKDKGMFTDYVLDLGQMFNN